MKNTMRKMAVLFLTFAMVFGFSQGAITAEAATTCTHPWESNLITSDPFKALALERDTIGTVTFLDSMEEAPARVWYMGKGYSKRVVSWVEWDGRLANVYFAAEGGINAGDCTEGLFWDMTELTEVAFNGAFHTEESTSMAHMFQNCSNLEFVDTETLNTDNVTSMYEMFRGCGSLTSVDVSTWNTSKVKSMYCMFSTCPVLVELDLSNFDTSKVTNMGFMFSACKSLERVDVSTWNTGKVTNMEGVFRWCDILEEPDLSSWDVSRVRVFSNFMNPGMRINCRSWEHFFN